MATTQRMFADEQVDLLMPEEVSRVLSIPHFRNSREARQRLNDLYLTYAACFVDLLSAYHFGSEPRVIADIGTGYGWLAVALARRTNAHIIAVETDVARMDAARQIAAVLGVAQRIEWRLGKLPNLPLYDQEADVTFCIEVIEHAGNDASIVSDLGRVTGDMLVVTTPNRLFPWIQHDTSLPFCHWLPSPLRDAYAALFRRLHLQDNNLFWSPGMLLAALPEFVRVSGLLQFVDSRHFLETELKLERACRARVSQHRRLRRYLFAATARLGPLALYALPNLASTFRRKTSSAQT